MPIPDHLKPPIDVAAVLGTLGSLIDALPAATSVLTFLWVAIRLYETTTVQKLIARLRARKPSEPDPDA